MSNVIDALIEALQKCANLYTVVDDVADKYIEEHYEKNHTYQGDLIDLLELAKQDIAQNYTPCPVDSKGETIHVGDMLSGIGEVYGVSETMVFAGDLIMEPGNQPPRIKAYIASGQTKCNTPLTRALLELLHDARGYESRDDAALVAEHMESIEEALNAVG